MPRNVRAKAETGLSTDKGNGSVPGIPADFLAEIPDAPILVSAVRSQESKESRPHARAWPNPRDSLDDLPVSLTRHFERQGAGHANLGIVEMPRKRMGPRSKFVAFMVPRFEASKGSDLEVKKEEEKPVEKILTYEKESEEMKRLIDKAREAEWQKYIKYSAAVPLSKEDGDALANEGHTLIPSKWVGVDKNSQESHEASYVPKVKSRLVVSCGNYEDQSILWTDSPTSERESRNLVAAFAAIHRCAIHSADVTSAYFQAQPLDRVVMMKPPRGGLPGVDSNQLRLVRVPMYGLCDSGPGFWKRLDGEAKTTGFVAFQVFPAFYFYGRILTHCNHMS